MPLVGLPAAAVIAQVVAMGTWRPEAVSWMAAAEMGLVPQASEANSDLSAGREPVPQGAEAQSVPAAVEKPRPVE